MSRSSSGPARPASPPATGGCGRALDPHSGGCYAPAKAIPVAWANRPEEGLARDREPGPTRRGRFTCEALSPLRGAEIAGWCDGAPREVFAARPRGRKRLGKGRPGDEERSHSRLRCGARPSTQAGYASFAIFVRLRGEEGKGVLAEIGW